MNREEFIDVLLENKWDLLEEMGSDQRKGIPHPPLQKACPENALLVNLVDPSDFSLETLSVFEAIKNRRSRRKFTDESISIEELSYLLWATQGVHKIAKDGHYSFRSVPSAGARHPFETYIVLNRVADLESGLYRYLPLDHKLVLLATNSSESMAKEVSAMTGNTWISKGAVVLFWVAVPYRTEWRYTYLALSKLLGQDSGHICQNLYLACESIGLGTSAVGAFGQEAADKFLELDSKEEFTLYLAPVGRV